MRTRAKTLAIDQSTNRDQETAPRRPLTLVFCARKILRRRLRGARASDDGTIVVAPRDFLEIVPNANAEHANTARPVRLDAHEVARLAKKLAFHTGKAAWTFGTSFRVLVVPLIVQLHREEQLIELEKEQLGVLSQPSGGLVAE